MKQFMSKAGKLLLACLLCTAILATLSPAASAAEVTMSVGDVDTLSWNLSLGVGYTVTSYGPATSSDPSVVSVTSYSCDSTGMGSMNIRANSAGTATVSCPVTLYYGKWDSVLGYWREDTQYLSASWTIEVEYGDSYDDDDDYDDDYDDDRCYPHDYSKEEVIREATTCKDGLERITCVKCGEYYQTTIDAPHKYDKGKVTVAPTPTTSGKFTQTCTLCGDEKISTYDKSHAVKITQQPSDACVKTGSKAKVTVKATGDGLKYQWYVKDVGSSKFTKSSIKTASYSVTMTKAKSGRQVYCVVTDKYGNKETSDTVTMYSSPVIKTQPKSVSVYRDETAKVTVKAFGKDVTYQWYTKNAGASKFSKSSNKTSTYKCRMDDGTNGRQVYCVVTDSEGHKTKTKTVTISMKPDRPVFITQQPEDTTVLEGKVVRVTVKATGKDKEYQWYYKDKGDTKFKKASIKTDTYAVTMTAKRKNRQVYCVIRDAYGNSVKSETVTLGMKTVAQITRQPVSTSAYYNKTAAVSVTARGDGLTYQWYQVASNGYVTPSSVTTRTYKITMNESRDGRKVYCVVTDKYGNQVQSDTVTLTMKNHITITKQPGSHSTTYKEKSLATVQATGEGLKYQWYIKNPGASKFSRSSVTTPTYSCTMTMDNHGRQVYCVITDQYGLSVKSDTATLSVDKTITITQQPKAISIYEGDTGTVSVEAIGAELTYRWYYARWEDIPYQNGWYVIKNARFHASSNTTPTYTHRTYVDLEDDDTWVFCRITNAFGNYIDTDIVGIIEMYY